MFYSLFLIEINFSNEKTSHFSYSNNNNNANTNNNNNNVEPDNKSIQTEYDSIKSSFSKRLNELNKTELSHTNAFLPQATSVHHQVPLNHPNSTSKSHTPLLASKHGTTSHSSLSNNWIQLKNHSAKCNIMVKKLRRGNKRSKSLPAKFK